jgi:peptide subunit release factor 1 (eRF1)
MQTNQLSADTLRRLAEMRPNGGKVVSVYLNLDPTEFASAQARSTEINSLLDDAERRAREESPAVRKDVESLRALLKAFDFHGAHGLAVFACSADDLLETIKLPRAVPSCVVIDDAPYVEPLVELQSWARYAVVLVNRQVGRIFRGSRDRLDEVAVLKDEVPRRHDQGGWSQARYQRSIDKEAQDHLRRTADALLKRYERSPFDALFVAAPEAVYAEFCGLLHPYLAERLAGRVEVDVENTTTEEVGHAAEEVIADYERALEKDTLDRLVAAKSSGGRGATGLEETLEALNEQRVEVLLLLDNFDAAGVCCPQCGWLGPPGISACPADGSDTIEREDITDLAVRRALTQSARVVVVRDDERLEPLGSIAALLRF